MEAVGNIISRSLKATFKVHAYAVLLHCLYHIIVSFLHVHHPSHAPKNSLACLSVIITHALHPKMAMRLTRPSTKFWACHV